jgi:hypothetical protein
MAGWMKRRWNGEENGLMIGFMREIGRLYEFNG